MAHAVSLHRMKRPAAAVACLAIAVGLGGCATEDAPAPTPTEAATGDTSTPTPQGTAGSPIVFALHCGDRVYTTYAAAWEARSASCTVTPLSGDEPSAQQSAAVAATNGTATLEDLAATCAEVGSAPWTDPVADAVTAHRADGLLRYCPGHPRADRLRDALAAYRG